MVTKSTVKVGKIYFYAKDNQYWKCISIHNSDYVFKVVFKSGSLFFKYNASSRKYEEQIKLCDESILNQLEELN